MTAIEKPEDSEKGQKEEITLPQETLEVFGGDELRSRVFYEKYALRDASGMQVEKTPDQLWLRVARRTGLRRGRGEEEGMDRQVLLAAGGLQVCTRRKDSLWGRTAKEGDSSELLFLQD